MNDRPKNRKPPGRGTAVENQTGPANEVRITRSGRHLITVQSWLAAIAEHGGDFAHPCVVAGAQLVLETAVPLDQIIREGDPNDPPPPKFGKWLDAVYEGAAQAILNGEPRGHS